MNHEEKMILLWILILVLVAIILVCLWHLINDDNLWTSCECVNPQRYGCSCKEWVDYCFVHNNEQKNIQRCISGGTSNA